MSVFSLSLFPSLSGGGKALAVEQGGKINLKTAAKFVPFLGVGLTLWEVGSFAYTAYDIFNNMPDIKNTWDEIRNSPEVLQRMPKCVSDKDCERLAFQAGELLGNLVVNGRHTAGAGKNLIKFMKNLKGTNIGSKLGSSFRKNLAATRRGLSSLSRKAGDIAKRTGASVRKTLAYGKQTISDELPLRGCEEKAEQCDSHKDLTLQRVFRVSRQIFRISYNTSR